MSSFDKHTWVTGETVTAVLLNRVEDAIDYLYENGQTIADESDCDALFDDFLSEE